MTQWGLDTLFNPAKRHMDDEKRRLQSTREEVGDNSGGRRIDLESGKVVIPRRGDEETDETGPSAETDGTAETDGPALADESADESAPPEDATSKKGKPAPSAAAQRAAARRGRTAR